MLLMLMTPAAILPLAIAPDNAGSRQPEGPTYTLRLTLDGGFGATGFGRSIDHTGNRLYLASTDGLRFLDLTTGDIGDFVSRSRFTGPFVVAPDVNRVFAEIDSNRVAFLDASSYEEVGHIPRRDFSRLTYDPDRRELYVFAAGASRAEVFDALTARPVATVELPSWGADGEVLAPGRLFRENARRVLRAGYVYSEAREIRPAPEHRPCQVVCRCVRSDALCRDRETVAGIRRGYRCRHRRLPHW
jgi:hypothetical protein